MANLTESPIYEPGIFQLEKTTPPLGGAPAFNGSNPSAGHANVQGLQLANRTAWLKQQLEAGGSATTLASDLANNTDPTKGATKVGWDDGTVADVLLNSKSLSNYTLLRAYTGIATSVRILAKGIQGLFYHDVADTTSNDNGGTIIVGIDGRRWKRFFVGPIYVEWFGTKADNTTDDAPAINAAIDSISPITGPGLYGSGGIVVLAAGRMRIKSPINVKFGVTLMGRGSDIYQSNISVDPTFVGSAALIVRAASAFSYTNGHIKGVGVSCNNVPNVGGILYAGAYNNCSIEDSFVIDVHGDAIGLEVRPMNTSESTSPTTVCESLLLKDLYIIHYDSPSTVTKPTIKLNRCQESTLINVKAFSARNKSSPLATNQSAILLEDCRGVSILGGASVGAKYGITISAVTRNAVGFKIAGFTYELISDYALNCVGASASFLVTSIDHDVPRYETPMPTSGFYAKYTQNSNVHTGIKGATLDVGVLGISLEDYGSGTVTSVDGTARYTRRVTPNAVNNRSVIESSAGVEIHANNTPGFRFTAGSRTDFWNLNWSASDAVNNGLRVSHSSGRTVLVANDNGTASTLAFFGNNPIARPTITGSRGSNAALTSLITQLVNLGLIVDSTTT